MARPINPFQLDAPDRIKLKRLLSGGIQPVRVVRRAQTLLKLDEGLSAPRVSQDVGFAPQAIRVIAKRYKSQGLERALHERQRAGRTRLLSEVTRQRIIALTRHQPPIGRKRWTVRLLVQEAMRRNFVSRIGRETIRTLLESHQVELSRKS
jgi:transposase